MSSINRSVDWGNQARLDTDHAGDRADRALSELFRAHTSPAFLALSYQAAGIEPPGTPHSVPTCEKVPTSDRERVENHPDTYELVERTTDAREALHAALSQNRDRQRKILALIEAGEIAHAKRFALCRRKSVQLECPDEYYPTEWGEQHAGGCGSDDNYVPVHCDSRLCDHDMRRKQGQVAGQYRPVVENWDCPTMLRLSLPSRVEPTEAEIETGLDRLRNAFGKFRRRVIPPEGEHQDKRWVWKRDGGEPADHYWKQALMQAGERRLAKYLELKYVEQGRGIPVDEVLREGFYGVDIKQDPDDGTLNIHLHVLADCPYIPQAALSALWDDLTDAPVVDVRRIEERGEQDRESAVMETIGYAAKAPEFETVEAEVAYFQALKGSKLVQPFGDLHGNTPEVPAFLRCSECDSTPEYWNYERTVNGYHDNMTVEVGGVDGDRPPP
ncbi:MAG: hypothetical protein ABEH77_05875 [Halobacteriaceae archaeon]